MPLLFVFFFLCSLILQLDAQQTSSRTCRILFLERSSHAPKTLYLFDGKTAVQVDLPRMNFSPVYEISATATRIVLLPTSSANPEAIPAEAPQAILPKSLRDFYLLVSHDPGNSVVPVKFQVVDADRMKLKNGQMLWFNLTENAVGGRIGSQQLTLGPRSRAVVDRPAVDSESYEVKLVYQKPGEVATWPLSQTRWRYNPQSRGIYFVIVPSDSRIPRVFGFSDFRPDTASPKPTAD